LYSSADIKMIKLWWMRWARQVARTEEIKMRTEFSLGSLKGRHHSEDLSAEGGIM
jgi:hypothetical protein